MTCYALLLRPDAWPAKSQVVRGDRVTEDDVLTIWEGERAVYRVPAQLVIEVLAFDNQKAAAKAVNTFITKPEAGGATVHVAELGVTARPTRARPGERSGGGTAVPAEGISVRITE